MTTRRIALHAGRCHFKPSAGPHDEPVTAEGIVWQVWHAIAVATRILAEHGLYCMVTSLNDERHRAGSKHYSGEAVDLRSHHIPAALEDRVLEQLRAALGRDYDVILEARGTPNEHIHCEFDPKPNPARSTRT